MSKDIIYLYQHQSECREEIKQLSDKLNNDTRMTCPHHEYEEYCIHDCFDGECPYE